MSSQLLPLSYDRPTAIRLLASKLKPYEVGKRVVSIEMQLRVLDKIFSLSNPQCYASAEKLAEYLFCDERTVRAVISSLVSQRLLRQERQKGYGRPIVTRQVDFETVRQLLSGEEVAKSESHCESAESKLPILNEPGILPGSNVTETVEPTGRPARYIPGSVPATNRAVCPVHTGQPARLPIERVKPPPPSDELGGGGGGARERIIRRLEASGVNKRSEAIESAINAGRSLAEVERLISFFESCQSDPRPPGAGLLVAWLTGHQAWPLSSSLPSTAIRKRPIAEEEADFIYDVQCELKRSGVNGDAFAMQVEKARAYFRQRQVEREKDLERSLP